MSASFTKIDKSWKSGTMLVNTKNKCFFCLNIIQENYKATIKGHGRNSPFLQFSRFLGIKLDDNLEEGNSIVICQTCEEVTEKLTSFWVKLEETRMWIQHFLKRLADVMSKDLKTSEGPDGALRVLFKEKCISRLKKEEGPQVKLCKAEKTIKDEPLSPKQVESQPEFLRSSCPFCDKTLMSSQELNFHTINVHPEQLLSSAKCVDLSDDKFQTLCQKLFTKECQLGMLNGQLSCSYCPTTYSHENVLKAHLYDSHLYILTRKLERQQRVGSETPKMKKPDSVSKVSKKLSNKQVYQNVLVVDVTMSGKSRPFACQSCPKRFRNPKVLREHVLKVHKSPFKPLPSSCSTSTAAALPNKIKKTCEYCGKCYADGNKHNCKQPRMLNSVKPSEELAQITINEDEDTGAICSITSVISKNECASGNATNVHLPASIRGNNPKQDIRTMKMTSRVPSVPKVAPPTPVSVRNDSLPVDMISWECLECGQAFATPDDLDLHKNVSCTRTRPKPNDRMKGKTHVCPICKNAAYRLHQSLVRHMKECGKTITCTRCGNTYSSFSTLQRHQKLYCKGLNNETPDESVSYVVVPQNEDAEALYYDEGNEDITMSLPEHDPLSF